MARDRDHVVVRRSPEAIRYKPHREGGGGKSPPHPDDRASFGHARLAEIEAARDEARDGVDRLSEAQGGL